MYFYGVPIVEGIKKHDPGSIALLLVALDCLEKEFDKDPVLTKAKIMRYLDKPTIEMAEKVISKYTKSPLDEVIANFPQNENL